VNTLQELARKLEAQGYCVALQLLAPGTTFGAHRAGERRLEAVLSGQLRWVVSGRPRLLGPGDWLEIPAGARASAEVIGDEPVLSLDAARPVTAPRRRAPPAAGNRR
jgi:quercetin dioxygenase-like cupin family protein